MVRVAEGPAAAQPALAESARDRGDHADAQRLPRVERRQDAGKARGQHRLAGARRADHQQVVGAGRGHLKGALDRLLPLDVAQVGIVRRGGGHRRRRRRLELGPLEMVGRAPAGRPAPRPRRRRPRRPRRRSPPGRSGRARAHWRRSRPAARRPPESARRRGRARRARHRRRGRPPPAPPIATRSPSAIGRSKWLPSFCMSAGARFTVIRFAGSASPRPASAPRTRSRLSATALSGRPTTVNAGRPAPICTCTSTGSASIPRKATVSIWATMQRLRPDPSASIVGEATVCRTRTMAQTPPLEAAAPCWSVGGAGAMLAACLGPSNAGG